MSNLVKRTIFGAIYVALIVTSLLYFRPYYFQFLFILITVFATNEFYRILSVDRFVRIGGALLAWLMFGSVTLFVSTALHQYAFVFALLYAFVLLLMIIAELFKKADDPISNWGALVSGQVLIALPFTTMAALFAQSPLLLLSMFVIIWTNDTGAYCVGSLIGKHKMFPRVSPAKSWEGLIGGAIFGIAVGYLFLADPLHFTGLHLTCWQSILLSFVVVCFGTLGDLIESLTKRTIGIKDSGNVIPGHGGWLDRFDSSLLAAPTMFITYLLL